MGLYLAPGMRGQKPDMHGCLVQVRVVGMTTSVKYAFSKQDLLCSTTYESCSLLVEYRDVSDVCGVREA